MKLNSLIFPAPESTYQLQDLEKVILVPKNANQLLSGANSIPCAYFPYIDQNNKGSDKLLIYFHGNAEDLGSASDFLACFRDNLKINILAMEYRGYGWYQGHPSEKAIVKDAATVYDFLVQKIGFEEKNIIIFGRSIGTGVATNLASKRNPCSLILMSAFSSFKAVTRNLVGCFLSLFVAERFKNIQMLDEVKCPIFLIHGKRDALVPCEQSYQMYTKCKSKNKPCEYWFSNKMTHNSFNMMTDILIPIDNFLNFHQIDCNELIAQIIIPEEFTEIQNFSFLRPNRKTLLAKIYNRLIE